MLFEDPATGLTVLAGLIVVAMISRVVVSPFVRKAPASAPPLLPVLDALRGLDDDQMSELARRLGRLPGRDRRVAAAAQPLAAALLDWRLTFDDDARLQFLDLANTLLSDYDDRAGPGLKRQVSGTPRRSV